MESKRLRTVGILLLPILLFTSGAFIFFYEVKINGDYFSPGVEIGGISIQGYNLEEAATAISQALFEFNNSSVTFYKDDYIYTTKLGELYSPIDVGLIVETVWKEEKNRSWLTKMANFSGTKKFSYPVAISYESAVNSKLIQDWDAKFGIPSKNAAVEVNSKRGLVIVPGQAGSKVDAEATFKALPTKMETLTTLKVPIVVVNQEPQVNEAMLENMGELASFSTFFNTAEVNRSHNLYLAASSINKYMLAPYGVFSFNNTVGLRAMETGYLDAMVIVGNKFEPGLGGGICQVSSTLYNACLLAGMEITERSNHGLAVAYVPLGRDATVAYGIQDFKFKNNTDSPIYIRCVTSGGKITVNIYGNLKYKQKIDVYHIVDQTLDFTVVKETDLKLMPGEQKVDHNGQLGYVVRSFRSFYGTDGKIIKTELLARDTYKPLNKLILQGPPLPETPDLDPIPSTGTEEPVIDPKPDPINPVPITQPPTNNDGQETPPSVPPASVEVKP